MAMRRRAMRPSDARATVPVAGNAVAADFIRTIAEVCGNLTELSTPVR
jgi:hypothetical protein